MQVAFLYIEINNLWYLLLFIFIVNSYIFDYTHLFVFNVYFVN